MTNNREEKKTPVYWEEVFGILVGLVILAIIAGGEYLIYQWGYGDGKAAGEIIGESNQQNCLPGSDSHCGQNSYWYIPVHTSPIMAATSTCFIRGETNCYTETSHD